MAAVRKTMKARDIPRSWQVDLPDDPDAEVNVWISPIAKPMPRPLVDFIGSGKGAYATREEADEYIRHLRREWQN